MWCACCRVLGVLCSVARYDYWGDETTNGLHWVKEAGEDEAAAVALAEAITISGACGAGGGALATLTPHDYPECAAALRHARAGASTSAHEEL